MTDAEASTEEGADDALPPEPEIERLHGVPVSWSGGPSGQQQVLHPSADEVVELARTLAGEGFTFCADLTAVDYLTYEGRRHLPVVIEPERFEVVVNLRSLATAGRMRLRVQVPADEPVLPSLFEVFPGADAMEREVFDMFGIEFTDHPDLTRILMPEDWEGHPLRKDFAVGRIPVQFKGAPSGR
ncbi:MAG: NADH-quinone oxidoreductase subunit C [Actinomycetia bacterium]|nr:NADH-quinone oxidoreductase subunit C [Actinomycetes bacterium]MCP4086029.1 NADH-quinone oxidoreductase subunit C [Actinomycetes bacterium]